MFRSLFVILGVFCGTLVLAQLIALGLMWSRGYLTAHTIREIRLLMAGGDEGFREQEENRQAAARSQQEIQEKRMLRILDLQTRENELSYLKVMAEDANKLLSQKREEFDKVKTDFRNELDDLQKKSAAAGVEQARAVLLASPIDDAVNRLMAVKLEEAVELVRGMPEKSIAKILQGFRGETSRDREKVDRGTKIFQAINRGGPVRELAEQTLDRLGPDDQRSSSGK